MSVAAGLSEHPGSGRTRGIYGSTQRKTFVSLESFAAPESRHDFSGRAPPASERHRVRGSMPYPTGFQTFVGELNDAIESQDPHQSFVPLAR